jgi:hypothetical protein
MLKGYMHKYKNGGTEESGFTFGFNLLRKKKH